ncbi:hypothetical protein VPNG_09548 [Cytospora leucostoma]|uniref:C2H2-type domain-containing protein n=1 Tax=Cytospora leucostoma TaxID=1230097 RepID=A0A423VQF0_9PEZI|nr:hypothetical protein VPNG_09548 [Cytospora leucostoma]
MLNSDLGITELLWRGSVDDNGLEPLTRFRRTFNGPPREALEEQYELWPRRFPGRRYHKLWGVWRTGCIGEDSVLDCFSDNSSISETESVVTHRSSEASISPDELAALRRDILVDQVTHLMTEWLDSRLGLLALQSHQSGTSQSPHSAPPGQENSSGQSQDSHHDRRPAREGERDRDDASDAGGSDRRDPNATDNGKDGDKLEFACPFLKHNPDKYRKFRNCSSYGWKSIHRIKEHLYRRHLLPQFKCIRCCQVFQTSDALTEHSKAEVACEVVQDEPDQDGINQEQFTKLKSRKRCRDFERTDKEHNRESLLTALREHVGRESPRLIRPRLKEFLDETLKGSLTPQILENLLRDVFTQVINTFPQRQRPPLEPHTEAALATDTCAPEPAAPPSVKGDAPVPTLLPAVDGQYQPGSWPTEDWEPGLEHASTTYYWQQPGQIGETPAGPSDCSLAQDSHTSGRAGVDLLGPESLATIFNVDDFHADYAGWFLQPGETGSHADSGYFSLCSAEEIQNDTGKGKEVDRDPFAGF